jgi:tRNA(fMet)-specific endonuclease VapC
MLDTNICSFIIRRFPEQTLKRLQTHHDNGQVIVISVITFYEMRLGAVGKKAPARLGKAIDAFLQRLDGVLEWTVDAADQAARVHARLSRAGQVIGPNDTMIAGHALASKCTLVSNNLAEFQRVKGLRLEDWAQ